ncbi:hypothetical protein D3C77_577430 [compost metagenome]
MQGRHLPAVLHRHQHAVAALQAEALQAVGGALDVGEPGFVGFLQGAVADRHGQRAALHGSEEAASEIEHCCYTSSFVSFVCRCPATSSTAWTMPV